MNVAAQYDRILKLRTLAEHPDTPPMEAASARRRMGEIEAKIRAAAEAAEQERKRAQSVPSKAKISSLKNKKGNGNIQFPVEWPFGWDKRDKIEVEAMFFDSEKKIVLGWKCPSCQMHVERTITQRHRARLMGKSDGVNSFIDRVRAGSINQLCDDCWRKHQ